MRGERLPSVMRGVSPCAECTEKYTACHDKCPKYQAWKAEVEKVKEAKKAYETERQQAYEEWNRRKSWQR